MSSPSSEASSGQSSPTKEQEGQVTLPWPIAEIIRKSEEAFATQWFNDLSPLFAKLLEWSLFFFLGYFGFGYGWIVFIATVHYAKYRQKTNGLSETIIARLSAMGSEQEVLGSALKHFPAWVSFPDFERTEWINDILKQLWPSFDGYATFFIVNFIEPEIQRILDQLRLETVSRFHVKKVAVGTIPARLGGIKVYDKKASREEIIFDTEVIYNGDAKVLITVQGVQAEIKQISFRGTARVTLKPIFNTFPFVGGFEFYFLNKPLLEYSLGGIGAFAEAPGASQIIKTVVEDQIRSRFVWPNKFHMYLPIDQVAKISDKSFLLAKPAGLLVTNLKGARNLEKKDTSITGSGSSDPYAIVTIGERKINFRDKYVPKTVNPTWDYSAEFIMEDYHGQDIKIDVYDHDNSSSDDFLGRASVALSSIVNTNFDEWITLEDVKHGDLRMACEWYDAVPLNDRNPEKFRSYVLSILVDSCKNLAKPGAKTNPYPRCNVKHTQNLIGSTKTKNKTRDPVFEESFMCVSKNFATESLLFEVVDTKSSDQVLGKVRIPLSFILNSPRREFFNMNYALEEGLNQAATINISAKIYGVA